MARVIYWFRTDLRLHDSPALQAALDLKPAALFPLWIWDPNYVYKHRVGLNRFRFLLESMRDVSDSIQQRNAASQLLVVRGDPVDLLPELWKRWRISHIVFEKDVNGYARERDKAVRELAEKAGVTVVERNGLHLWDIDDAVQKANGKPLTSIKSFEKIIESLPAPPKPVAAPSKLPSPTLPDAKGAPKNLADALRALHASLKGLSNYHDAPGPPAIDLNSAELGGEREPGGKVTCYDSLVGPDQQQQAGDNDVATFSVPTLASLGMDPKKCGVAVTAVVPGGETEGLRRLKKLCEDHAYLAGFSKPKTSPACDTTKPSTTLLSPFLKFGCVSIRKLWHDSHDSIAKHKGKRTTPPENLDGQLMFREMYACAELAVGAEYQRVRGNQICRYMDWYLPTHYDEHGKPIEPRPRGDDVSEARLEAFRKGQTGFPWIDAGVRQLKHTGWIHHLMRHSLACFLTRGQCWISWERGAELFDEWLLDWSPQANGGNWMWLSCSAFFAQFFRVYGLATFGRKSDPHGELIRLYCPELKEYPDKYIYEPHTAPLEVQRKANCVIGKDYPSPILDEKAEKERCLSRMKIAYAEKLYGTSKQVLDGKAEGILRKKHGQPDPQPPKVEQGTNNKIPDWAKPRGDAKSANGQKADEPKAKMEESEGSGSKKRKADTGKADSAKRKH